MKVVIYCPDRHIEYSGATPEEVGVGGGVTARIHLARALARRGNDVTVVANCPREETVDAARFLPLDAVARLEGDVVVLNTSGGALSLEPAGDLEITTGRLLLWVHGVSPLRGLDRFSFDGVVVPSDFIAGVVKEEWGYPPPLIRAIPNGFERYPVARDVERDPYRLVYTSHPEKGLSSALAVLHTLRHKDQRYHMHLYGGAGLWGQDPAPISEDGVTDHGLVSQPEIASELRKAGFALHLQAIPEAFSISVSEAMAAGAIVVASPVGALAERIGSGRNGILIKGDYRDDRTIRRAARGVAGLVAHRRRADRIRRAAITSVPDWDDVAGMWEHWLADNPD